MKLDRLIVLPILLVVSAAVVGGARSAFAQADTEMPADDAADTTEPPLPAEVPPYPDRRSDVLGPPEKAPIWMPMSGVGMALFVGGGVTDFLEASARNDTRTGGAWTARLTVGTRSIVAVDASYVGGANAINGLGGGNATLLRNGLEGALRLNAPLVARDTLLEPYALAGIGWNSYHLTGTSGASASLSPITDSTLSVPLAAGFTVGYHGFLADLRFTLRPTYGQNVFTGETGSALSNWDLGAMLGYEF
jgi:hypothetical protein